MTEDAFNGSGREIRQLVVPYHNLSDRRNSRSVQTLLFRLAILVGHAGCGKASGKAIGAIIDTTVPQWAIIDVVQHSRAFPLYATRKVCRCDPWVQPRAFGGFADLWGSV